jgi:hypothetical protein
MGKILPDANQQCKQNFARYGQKPIFRRADNELRQIMGAGG